MYINIVLVLLISHLASSTSHPSDRITSWLIPAVKKSLSEANANACGPHPTPHPCAGRDISNAAVSTYLISAIENNGSINTTGTMHFLSQVQPDVGFVGNGFCALAHEEKFTNALNETSKTYLLHSINKALPSLSIWQSIDVSYSNMYFMGMINCIICGEAPGVDRKLGTAAAQHGYDLLDKWLIYAASAGNHEFDSPTYYWVQMNALSLGCMYAKNTMQKKKICSILEHLWADVASSFFQPTETLSGAHSRDYDFLYGHGALQVLTYINGLGTHPPICEFKDAHCERTDDGQNALVLLNAWHARDDSGIGHKPLSSTLALSKIPIRIIQSKWLGQNRTKNNLTAKMGDRYNYIRSGLFAIGSVSQDYITNTHHTYEPCPQDKLISIDLALPNMTQFHPVPSITLVHDWLDHPWGHLFANNPTKKPSHLAPHPGNVQHENILLATSALNPSEKLDGFQISGFESLATNVILPTKATYYYVWGDSVPSIPPTNNYTRQINLSSSSTVGIQVANSCLAIRILACDGVQEYNPTIEIKADEFGISLGAFRLVLYHYKGKNASLSSTSHVANGFLMVVDECDGSSGSGLISLVNEVANVVVDEIYNEETWKIKAAVRGTVLEVERDVSVPHCQSWDCVVYRKINGTDVVPKSLRVNGNIVVPLPLPS